METGGAFSAIVANRHRYGIAVRDAGSDQRLAGSVNVIRMTWPLPSDVIVRASILEMRESTSHIPTSPT